MGKNHIHAADFAWDLIDCGMASQFRRLSLNSCFAQTGVQSTSLGAVFHLLPIFGPRLAPRHLTTAHRTAFAGQLKFVAFEVFVHQKESLAMPHEFGL
jgi:hypothetical protein